MPLTAPPLLPHVEVDFNVRSGDGWVRTRLNKVSPQQDPDTGSFIWAIERHEGLRGLATVAKVDHDRGLLYLDVDWDSVRPAQAQSPTTSSIWELAKSSGGRFGIKSAVPNAVPTGQRVQLRSAELAEFAG